MAVVRILNPIPGHADHTSRSAAERYCRQGVARMEAGRLRFLEASEREAAIRRRFIDPVTGTGIARLDWLRNYPVAGDPVKLLLRRGGGPKPLGRNGRARSVL